VKLGSEEQNSPQWTELVHDGCLARSISLVRCFAPPLLSAAGLSKKYFKHEIQHRPQGIRHHSFLVHYWHVVFAPAVGASARRPLLPVHCAGLVWAALPLGTGQNWAAQPLLLRNVARRGSRAKPINFMVEFFFQAAGAGLRPFLFGKKKNGCTKPTGIRFSFMAVTWISIVFVRSKDRFK